MVKSLKMTGNLLFLFDVKKKNHRFSAFSLQN